MSSLTLAAVVDIEAASTTRGRDTHRQAQSRLDNAVAALALATTAPIDTVILYGENSAALRQHASEHGYKLIVTSDSGRRPLRPGRGASRRLAAHSDVPVLVVPVAGARA